MLTQDTDKDKYVIYTILSGYTIVEYLMFSFFLYSVIEQKRFRLFIIISSAIFFIFGLLYFLHSSYQNFDSLSASIESILIITYCIFYLFEQLNKPQVMFIYQHQNFWFVAGFLVYLSASFFLFIEASHLAEKIRDAFWNIYLTANIFKNILFAIAFSRKEIPILPQSFESPFEDSILESPYKT